ncbi:MAG: ribonuclease Z [archaeon]|nr:ribonuclease Z [archaeon]
MFDILFLGTGASIPSRKRSTSCLAVRQGRSISLFDCGEGSQRQLMMSQMSFMKIDRIFISHMHGDHILGLPGLLQTMGLSGRTKTVTVYGPNGLEHSLTDMLNACEGELKFEIQVIELKGGELFNFDEFTVSTFMTVHNVPSIGYVYREKDRPGTINKKKAEKLNLIPNEDFSRLKAGETVKGVSPEMVMGKPIKGCSMVYTGDTAPCDAVKKHANGVDLLIHEATYIEKDIELAKTYFHSTAKAAAEIALACNIGMLVLTHISNRYDDSEYSIAEAKAIFGNVIAPNDFQMLSVSRSNIRLV